MDTTKLKLLLSGTAIAFAIFLLPSQATASSWNFYDKGSKGSCDKGSKGSYDKGSKGSYDKGSKGSYDKGSKGSYDKGSKGSYDKGSKGSCDKYDMINTGIVRGNVYQDFNQNGIKDLNESGVASIKVTIVDANNTIFVTYTDTNGTYIQKGVSEGEALVTVDDTTLPMYAELTAGLNPSTVMVVPYIDTMKCSDYIYNYEKNCTMDANTSYNKYNKYMNHNRSYDNEKNCTMDANTSYNKYNKYMDNNRSYDNEKNCTMDANTSYNKYNKYMDNNCTIIYSEAGDDGYTFPTPVGTLYGQVVVDGQGYPNITLYITDANGDIHTVITDINGNWTLDFLPIGEATVDVDETTLPDTVARTIGMDNDTFTIEAGSDTNAGIDGYIIAAP